MEYGKIVTLADRCASYAKFCGKKRIIETLPVTKIPKQETLGYICPDGTINFSSAESAIQYMRTKCVNALAKNKPYEYCVEIDGSRITYESKGSISGCWHSSKPSEIGGHGHPDTYAKGCTTAPSVSDYYPFMESKSQKKEIVFNSNGEQYVLEKIPNVRIKNDIVFGNYSEIDILGIKHYSGCFPESVQKKLDIAIENRDETMLEEIANEYLPQSPKEVTKDLVERTHTFWLKYGQRFGVKIDTNFSNFKNISL